MSFNLEDANERNDQLTVITSTYFHSQFIDHRVNSLFSLGLGATTHISDIPEIAVDSGYLTSDAFPSERPNSASRAKSCLQF